MEAETTLVEVVVVPMFDPVTEQLLAHVDRLGYTVGILDAGAETGGRLPAGVHRYQITGEDRNTGEQQIVRGEDPYAVACELAVKLGIELEG